METGIEKGNEQIATDKAVNVNEFVISLRAFIKDQRMKLDEEITWAETMDDTKRIDDFLSTKIGFRIIENWLKKQGL